MRRGRRCHAHRGRGAGRAHCRVCGVRVGLGRVCTAERRLAVADDPAGLNVPVLGAEVHRVCCGERAAGKQGQAHGSGRAFGMDAGKITTVPGVELDLDVRDAHHLATHVEQARPESGPMIGTWAEDGHVWRYLVAPIAIQDSPSPAEVSFVLVYDIEAEFDEAARMFVIASAIVLAVIAATGTVVATRLLRPLRHMRTTAEQVSARSLDERIPVVGNDDVAELAETMNEMLDRLDDALDSQRQLLSDVGHELKTPITIVRGHVELMDPHDPNDAQETRELALDELGRMGQLVQDLSAAAALHGPSPVKRSPVDTSDLLEQIVKKASAIEGASVRLTEKVDRVAFLDADRITQAMLQLAQNAVSHGGGDIEIGGRSDGVELRLWVRNHGAGVDEEESALIFERFARGASATHRAGSGLGLSIVRLIVRAHGGEVEVANVHDGGALFTMRIPHASETADDARAPDDSAQASSEGA